MGRKSLYDANYLKELAADPNSGVKLKTTTRKLLLLPYHLRDISGAVAEILNSLLLRHDKQLDGIILGYLNAKLLDKNASCLYESSTVAVHVIADFYVFKPALRRKYTGIVHKLGIAHVGCLLYDHFNISLPIPTEKLAIMKELKIETKVTFTLVDMDLTGNLPYFRGELQLPGAHSNKSKAVEGSKRTAKNETKKQKKADENSTDPCPGKSMNSSQQKSNNAKKTSLQDEQSEDISRKKDAFGKPREPPAKEPDQDAAEQEPSRKNTKDKTKKKKKLSLSLHPAKVSADEDEGSDHIITPYQRPRSSDEQNTASLSGLKSPPLERLRGLMKSLLDSPLKDLLENSDLGRFTSDEEVHNSSKNPGLREGTTDPRGVSQLSATASPSRKANISPNLQVTSQSHRIISSSSDESDLSENRERLKTAQSRVSSSPAKRKSPVASNDETSSEESDSRAPAGDNNRVLSGLKLAQSSVQSKKINDDSTSGESDSEDRAKAASSSSASQRISAPSKSSTVKKGKILSLSKKPLSLKMMEAPLRKSQQLSPSKVSLPQKKQDDSSSEQSDFEQKAKSSLQNKRNVSSSTEDESEKAAPISKNSKASISEDSSDAESASKQPITPPVAATKPAAKLQSAAKLQPIPNSSEESSSEGSVKKQTPTSSKQVLSSEDSSSEESGAEYNAKPSAVQPALISVGHSRERNEKESNNPLTSDDSSSDESGAGDIKKASILQTAAKTQPALKKFRGSKTAENDSGIMMTPFSSKQVKGSEVSKARNNAKSVIQRPAQRSSDESSSDDSKDEKGRKTTPANVSQVKKAPKQSSSDHSDSSESDVHTSQAQNPKVGSPNQSRSQLLFSQTVGKTPVVLSQKKLSLSQASCLDGSVRTSTPLACSTPKPLSSNLEKNPLLKTLKLGAMSQPSTPNMKLPVGAGLKKSESNQEKTELRKTGDIQREEEMNKTKKEKVSKSVKRALPNVNLTGSDNEDSKTKKKKEGQKASIKTVAKANIINAEKSIREKIETEKQTNDDKDSLDTACLKLLETIQPTLKSLKGKEVKSNLKPSRQDENITDGKEAGKKTKKKNKSGKDNPSSVLDLNFKSRAPDCPEANQFKSQKNVQVLPTGMPTFVVPAKENTSAQDKERKDGKKSKKRRRSELEEVISSEVPSKTSLPPVIEKEKNKKSKKRKMSELQDAASSLVPAKKIFTSLVTPEGKGEKFALGNECGIEHFTSIGESSKLVPIPARITPSTQVEVEGKARESRKRKTSESELVTSVRPKVTFSPHVIELDKEKKSKKRKISDPEQGFYANTTDSPSSLTQVKEKKSKSKKGAELAIDRADCHQLPNLTSSTQVSAIEKTKSKKKRSSESEEPALVDSAIEKKKSKKKRSSESEEPALVDSAIEKKKSKKKRSSESEEPALVDARKNQLSSSTQVLAAETNKKSKKRKIRESEESIVADILSYAMSSLEADTEENKKKKKKKRLFSADSHPDSLTPLDITKSFVQISSRSKSIADTKSNEEAEKSDNDPNLKKEKKSKKRKPFTPDGHVEVQPKSILKSSIREEKKQKNNTTGQTLVFEVASSKKTSASNSAKEEGYLNVERNLLGKVASTSPVVKDMPSKKKQRKSDKKVSSTASPLINGPSVPEKDITAAVRTSTHNNLDNKHLYQKKKSLATAAKSSVQATVAQTLDEDNEDDPDLRDVVRRLMENVRKNKDNSKEAKDDTEVSKKGKQKQKKNKSKNEAVS